jgi:glyoxylase-like metal-dependent hydrolase (beta-lactamase superfamily II)
MPHRSVLLPCLVVLASLALPAALAQTVVRTADPVRRGVAETEFPRLIPLAEHVYAYEELRPAGSGRMTTNSLVVVTDEGVLVADGQGNPEQTRALVDRIGTVTDKPIRYIVICSDHGDHTGGNQEFPDDAIFIAHPTSKKVLESQARDPARKPDAPRIVVPVRTVADRQVMKLGGVEIHLLFLGRAHTGGDLSVYLPRQKILFMSEAYLNRVFPAMRSAYPSEWVAALDRALAMDVDRYVPGHGFVEEPRVSREELVAARDALQAVIAEVKRLHAQGLSAEEAVRQAAFGPYDDLLIRDQQGPVAVRQVYKELAGELR